MIPQFPNLPSLAVSPYTSKFGLYFPATLNGDSLAESKFKRLFWKHILLLLKITCETLYIELKYLEFPLKSMNQESLRRWVLLLAIWYSG